MDVTIIVRKTGGLWHGTLEGSNEIDERALTADIAERKARELILRKYAHERALIFSVRRIDPED